MELSNNNSQTDLPTLAYLKTGRATEYHTNYTDRHHTDKNFHNIYLSWSVYCLSDPDAHLSHSASKGLPCVPVSVKAISSNVEWSESDLEEIEVSEEIDEASESY